MANQMVGARPAIVEFFDDVLSPRDRIVLGVITALIGVFGVWFVVDHNSAQTRYGMCVAQAVADAARQGVSVDDLLGTVGCADPTR
ncbi:Uncharacterised protein [Mycolicibacterium phlei]|jgi:hypothetical protein|uniref:Uncharacterized protein n=1 Tax=Mycolicibacterium phlei DSM 43239 = CCUG 21000 TaxID=1226750 RepID=A0A5N5UX66_MYCPH|nr:hypothetical protein [Mycolicibacterium phlei]VEG07825.1 Uncharacterised protein [Mycobacteroides chelonae]AMO59697.1 hypothetical protein MPHLCCUG_00865 [Mycolicibacterium phlei]KAB7753587.1 hypothetical protein MPHL21000_20025 [Mycolicibacterium phlei DSM 43239 = CCUG 21000]KXW62490.1 hypothetical protein MPHL43239_19090 [Mycolicibacterium phlei DSM 43239 = CCUG 21000]KXW69829.1 hypothetical protein MPHL43072_04040 [Mycolicibacterium phlei DSM 43072]